MNGRFPGRIAPALALVALSGGAFAQGEKPKVQTDDVNPRSTSTLLKIELAPFWCPTCIKEKSEVEGLLPSLDAPFTLLHKDPAKIVEHLGLEPNGYFMMKTPHFKLFTTIDGATAKYNDSVFARHDFDRLKTIQPKIKFDVEGVKLDAHQRMHLYQVRLERLYAHFTALTNCTVPNLGMNSPFEIYLFKDYSQHHAFCDRYVGTKQDKSGVQWHIQDPPNFILFTCAESIVASQTAKGDGPLANHLAHNLGHLMIDGYGNYFRETPAWIEEGLGHYYERRENPRWNNFCFAEGKAPAEFTKPDWDATIFSMIRRDRDSPFATWCEKLQPGEMSGGENGMSWAFVRWLIETEPVRFTKMIEPMDDTKRNLNSAQMIEEGFGVTPSVLYQRFRDHVLAEWAGK